MLLKRIRDFQKDIFDKGLSYYDLGKDIFEAGLKVYNDRMNTLRNGNGEEGLIASDSDQKKKVKSKRKSPKNTALQIAEDDTSKKILRKNLEKNFSVPSPDDPTELARQKSLSSHQVKDQDPGERFNSNMWQRNFENHQGN